jgi:iron complex transport system substrate-binding protein
VGAAIISLDPRSLAEVAGSVRLLGSRLGAAERAEQMASAMLAAIETTATTVRGTTERRVFFAEWIEPPFCAGHWVPEMIALAGGRDVIGRAAEPSHPTSWETVMSLEPELVVVGACGFDAGESAARAAGVELPCPVVAVDGDAYYSRPAPRLADGVAQLAHLLHPDRAPDPRLPEIWLGHQPVAPRRR